jgi:Fic family protein
VQFETIHPFLDGNGRLGRLLITLILCNEGALREPLLYLSLYFKRNRERYYDLLQRVRTTGDWESWVRFFLDGVDETAGQAVALAGKIRDLFARDRQRIAKLGRVAGSALRVHELLQHHPLLSVPKAVKLMDLTPPTVRSSLTALAEVGIVREVSGRRRDRVYGYRRYLDLIASDTQA